MPRANRTCEACRGNRTVEVVKTIELSVPRGVRDGQQLDAGIVARHVGFEHRVDKDHNVHVKMRVTIGEMLCGLSCDLRFAGETHKIVAHGAFDPGSNTIVPGRGLTTTPDGPRANLVISYEIAYDDLDIPRLRKYRDVLAKVFKIDHENDSEKGEIDVVI